jgi:hypothetical protein
MIFKHWADWDRPGLELDRLCVLLMHSTGVHYVAYYFLVESFSSVEASFPCSIEYHSGIINV